MNLLKEVKSVKVLYFVFKIEKLMNKVLIFYDDEVKYFVKEVREVKRLDLKARVVKMFGEVVLMYLEYVC